jgi:hypothetical protein
MAMSSHDDEICAKILGASQQRLSNVLSASWHGFGSDSDPMAVEDFSHVGSR